MKLPIHYLIKTFLRKFNGWFYFVGLDWSDLTSFRCLESEGWVDFSSFEMRSISCELSPNKALTRSFSKSTLPPLITLSMYSTLWEQFELLIYPLIDFWPNPTIWSFHLGFYFPVSFYMDVWNIRRRASMKLCLFWDSWYPSQILGDWIHWMFRL